MRLKTLYTFLIALILANGVIQAEDYIDSQSVNYVLDPNSFTCSVTESPEAQGIVIIPSTLNVEDEEYEVTGIMSYAFNNNLSLKEITLPPTIQEIQENAFFQCLNLSKVNCEALTPPTCEENSFSELSPNASLIVNLDVAPDYYSDENLNNSFTYIIGQSSELLFNNGIYYKFINDYRDYPNDTYVDIGNNTSATGDIIIPGNIFNGNKYYLILGYTPYAFADSEIKSIDLSQCINMMDLGTCTFNNCTKLETIILPPYLYSNYIPSNTFTGCSSLKAIDLSVWNELNDIQGRAFENCTSLEVLKLPSSLSTIGSEAFFGCGNIAQIYCYALTPPTCEADSFEENIFENCQLFLPEGTEEKYQTAEIWKDFSNMQVSDELTDFIYDGINYELIKGTDHNVMVGENINYSGPLRLPSEVYYEGESYSVVSLGYRAFSGSGITSITLPSSFVNCGNSVFSFCTSLESANLSESSLNSLGNNCFYYCNNLKTVILPSTMVSIMGSAFYGCTNMESLTCYATIPPSCSSDFGEITENCILYVPEESLELYKEAQYWNEFVNIEPIMSQIIVDDILYNIISETDNEVSVAAGNSYNGELNLPAQIDFNDTIYTVVSIADNAFSECKELQQITLPSTINKIGESAFFGCTNLTLVDLSYTTITTVEDMTFLYCSNLETVILPSTLSNIGEKAFQGCSSLTYLTSWATVPPVCSTNAFDSTIYDTCNLKVPEESGVLYMTSNVWSNFTSLDKYKSFTLDGIVYELISNDEVIIGEGSNFEGYLTLDNYVSYNGNNYEITAIGANAFLNCETITGLELPSSIQSIGINAFSGCNLLYEINLEMSQVQILETATFSGCSALSNVVLPGCLNFISSYVFENCLDITSITCEALTPPTCEENSFDESIYSVCVLNVPEDVAELYMEAPIWKNFIIPTAVKNILNISGNVEIYTLDGVKIYNGDLQNAQIGKGIYLIKNNDKTLKIRK